MHEQLSRQTDGQLSNLTQSVIKAAEHGAELTHRLLAFSRKSPLLPDAINLERKIADMTDLMRRSIGEKVEIKTITVDGLWSCQADASQVENAVLNLCINARDAMPNGGTVTIATDNVTVDQDYSSLYSDVKKGEYVRITVTDTGTGITPEALEHVLEPFFTTKKVGEGSGLGLSMVYGFANQSKGHITIDSKVGHGTTIGLYLPRSKSQIEVGKTQQNTQIPDAKGETVLVVEDDHDLRALALATLKSLGYIVLEAENGKGAKAVLDEQKNIDLLLTDVVLPGDWDGPAISKYALERYPHIKTLFMSGYTENAFENNSLADEGYHLLNKPFRLKELAAKLRELLDETAL